MSAKRSGGLDNLCEVIDNHADLIDQGLTNVTIAQNGLIETTDAGGIVTTTQIANFEDKINDGIITTQKSTPNQLTFDLAAGEYQIDAKKYNISPTSVTLANGDAANDRIDTIYLDSTGADVETGTPSANPVAPTLANNQLRVKDVYVQQNSTSSTGTVQPQINVADSIATGTSDGQMLVWDNTSGEFIISPNVNLDQSLTDYSFDLRSDLLSVNLIFSATAEGFTLLEDDGTMQNGLLVYEDTNTKASAMSVSKDILNLSSIRSSYLNPAPGQEIYSTSQNNILTPNRASIDTSITDNSGTVTGQSVLLITDNDSFLGTPTRQVSQIITNSSTGPTFIKGAPTASPAPTTFGSFTQVRNSTDEWVFWLENGGNITLGSSTNSVTSSGDSIVLGGTDNTINNNSDSSAILGGEFNTVDGSRSVILAGGANTIDGSRSVILAGFANTIDGDSDFSAILAGRNNNINSNSVLSAILGGQFNTINGNSNTSAILGGQINTINGSSNASAILGGRDNLIDGDLSAILGGEQLTVNGSHTVGFSASATLKTVNDNNTFYTDSGRVRELTATQTSNYTALDIDYIIPVDTSGGVVTITLPATPRAGREYIVKDTGSAGTNTITVDGNGNNIEGSATVAITTNYGSEKLIFSGTEWLRV